MSPEPARYGTFHVDHLLVGVEVARLEEVLAPRPLTPVPLAPVEVRGVVNVRGRILTAVCLRRFLGLAPAADASAAHAVVRLGDEALSLLVDRPGDVVAPPASAEVPVPAATSERFRSRLSRAYAGDGRLLFVLDLASLDAVTARPQAERRPA